MKTDTIYYSGQGYIYRCPECNRVDRMGMPSKVESCRFCNKEFEPNVVSSMNDGLYAVIREINTLETGTPLGMSPQMLSESNVAKAGAAVGLDVPAMFSSPRQEEIDIDAYFAARRVKPNKLAELSDDVLKELSGILTGKPTIEELKADTAKPVPLELVEEAQAYVLIKNNPGLSEEEQLELLKAQNWRMADPYINKEGKVTIFFNSSVAPECDAWIYWEEIADG